MCKVSEVCLCERSDWFKFIATSKGKTIISGSDKVLDTFEGVDSKSQVPEDAFNFNGGNQKSMG